MALAGFKEPRSAFVALPFEVRDAMPGYRQTLLVLEDLFAVTVKHGDTTNDAVGIFERAADLMDACRVRIFDLTKRNANVVLELGRALGAKLPNVYAIQRRGLFGSPAMPSMLKHLDCQSYANAETLEKTLRRTLARHFWPVDQPFTLQIPEHVDWLETQIRQLTQPISEADKNELAVAVGLDASFMTPVILERFVGRGDAVALGMGPSPTYRFDYTSVRAVPRSSTS